MPSLDFEVEKKHFIDFYQSKIVTLENAKNSFIILIKSLLSHVDKPIMISKIEGRVKDQQECIRKFNLKYRTALEVKATQYSIQEHITDLIGLRIVCLYEDEIYEIEKCLFEHFELIDKTDKITQIENTEGSFGYKGLHLDLRLNERRKTLPEYINYSDFRFEVQIRTVIQDSWSELDHKIKYKKSIPIRLKRRINSLAALFELADREFREIRESTVKEIENEEISDDILTQETEQSKGQQGNPNTVASRLNAFSFLKIAKHFFNEHEFEPYKVDGFTQEIISIDPDITRGKFNFYMKENIGRIKNYQKFFEKSNPNDRLNPFTIIRHCLFLGDKKLFGAMLTNAAKESFEKWLASLSEPHN